MGSMKEFMQNQKAKKALGGDDIALHMEQAKVAVPQKQPPKTPAKEGYKGTAEKPKKNKGSEGLIPPQGGSSTAPPKPKGPAQPPPSPTKKKKKNWWRPVCSICQELATNHRLPVGSKFASEYVSEGLWKGTLIVPGLPPFNAEAKGVAKVNQNLDRQWQDVAYKPGERPYELNENIAKMKKKKQEEYLQKKREENQAKQGPNNPMPQLPEVPINEPLQDK